MKERKRACPDAVTSRQARRESHWTSGNSHTEHTTAEGCSQREKRGGDWT